MLPQSSMHHIEHTGVPVAQEQILAREHRAESARSRKKQAAAEAAAGKSTVTGGNQNKLLPPSVAHHGLLDPSEHHITAHHINLQLLDSMVHP